jgi:hypothetical protein
MRRLLASAGAAAALLFAAGGAKAAITVTENGTYNTFASESSIVITTTADCPVGAYEMVIFGAETAAPTISSVTDNSVGGPNTWSVKSQTIVTGNDTASQAAIAPITSDLASGKTITLTMSGNVSAKGVIAICVRNAASSSVVDISGVGANSGAGTSTAPSFTTAALAQASEVAIGFFSTNNTGTITEDGAFTTVDTQGAFGTHNNVHVAYKLTAATTAVTYAPTLGTAANWTDNVITLKAPASGTAHMPGSLILLGVGE